jgi:cytochrome c
MQLKLGHLLGGALLFGLAGAAAAQAVPDAAALAKGKRLFMLCASCHDATAGASAKIGPTLYGVVGRAAGSVPGVSYSADMKSKSFVWDEAQLDAWLVKPTAVVPGTSMAYLGMPDASQRKALIAFLSSLK